MKKNLVTSLLKWDILLIFAVFLSSFVIPVFPPEWGQIPIRIGFTLIFISGLMTMEKRNWIILYLSLAALIMQWVSGVLDMEGIADISRFLNVLFFLLVIFSLIREMVIAKVVTATVIMSSISGYLLLGIIYSLIVIAILQRDPGAYNIAYEGSVLKDPTFLLSKSIYYGLGTLATLGYGDVLPLKPYTRSLAILICTSGQLYIATIIGILIGKFASSGSNHNKRNDLLNN